MEPTQNEIAVKPPDLPERVGIDYALIATSAVAGVIALLYLVVF